jgi:hypothetical protein
MAEQPLPQQRLGEGISLGAARHLRQLLHVGEQGGRGLPFFGQHHPMHPRRRVGMVFDQLQQQQAQCFAQPRQLLAGRLRRPGLCADPTNG